MPNFIIDQRLDIAALFKATKVLARNLDKLIDQIDTAEALLINTETRAIGIGIQGLADAMTCLGMSMESNEATILNKAIAETVYYASIEASCELAAEYGRCTAWNNSPSAKGRLQYNLWHATPTGRYDWFSLKAKIRRHGLRNMLSVSLHPVPDAYNIAGVSSGINPITRRVTSSGYIIAPLN